MYNPVKEELSQEHSEVDIGSEPIYIEMDPSVYIPPSKDYRPKVSHHCLLITSATSAFALTI